MSALGDLIRAVTTLAPDPEAPGAAATRARIAELLGIPASVEKPAGQDQAVAPPVGQQPPPVATAPAPPPPPQVAPKADQRAEIDIKVVIPKRSASRAAVPLRPMQGPLDPPLAPFELQPLFRADWTRALLSTALARPNREAPVDVPALVDCIARMEAIRTLPRQLTPTLARGVQVLVDVGPGLGPFARDARELVAAIKVVAGAEHTEVRLFRGSPVMVAAERAPTRREPYRPPRAGVAVLAITDLGIAPVMASPSDVTAAWLDLHGLLRAQGSELIALVPYPADRWPSALVNLAVVFWDRATTVAIVKRALRGAR